MIVKLHLQQEDEALDYTAKPGDTYEDALLSFGINPDTVLIFFQGVSIPQDKIIEEDAVKIISTCTRG